MCVCAVVVEEICINTHKRTMMRDMDNDKDGSDDSDDGDDSDDDNEEEEEDKHNDDEYITIDG